MSVVKTIQSTAESRAVGSSNPEERPRVNLDFVDLHYPVRSSMKINDRKQILKGVSGSFKSGELTVILGSSGAGKSTLLNILTGYVSFSVGGTIRINGYPCHTSIIKKLSTYIMQDDLLQNCLTVGESMNIVSNLKLGKEFSKDGKVEVINQILNTLGLEKHTHTRVEKLSGGQRKRLAIALELISDPRVIFLDEPTTGLDVVSATQVIRLLQKLARDGRTVVCTVHQPSAFICGYFDHLYVMTRGCCVYQGSYKKLVPFLSHSGYECPLTHNPADFVIEVIHGRTKDEINAMAQILQNGKLSVEESEMEKENENHKFRKIIRQQKVSSSLNIAVSNLEHPIGFGQQFLILLKRRFLQQHRNLLTLAILFFHHILIGFLLGAVFQGVGQDAHRPFENFKFLVSVVVFFMYTNALAPVLLYPSEVKIMKREYFNGWYGLKAYFASLSVATLPTQICFGCFFIVLCYIISSQPMEVSRFIFFAATGLLLSYVSEGWGITVGSLFNCTNGSIVGPASLVPLLAVSVYGMGYGTAIEPFMQFLMSLSYLRYGVVGLTTAVYGRNRTLICDNDKTMYCHYKDSKLLLKDLGMEGTTVYGQIVALIVFVLLHRTTAYLGIKIMQSASLQLTLNLRMLLLISFSYLMPSAFVIGALTGRIQLVNNKENEGEEKRDEKRIPEEKTRG